MTEKEPNSGLAEKLAGWLGLKPGQASMVKLIAVAVALGVLFMNAGSLFGLTETSRRPPDATEVVAPVREQPEDELQRLELAMADRLEAILSQVEGAGEVQVTVTLATGPTVTPLVNTRRETTITDEVAADGSKRRTETVSDDQSNVMSKDLNQDLPAVASRSRAEVAGVLIVAEGARSPAVRARLHSAAATALNIPAHRIAVVPAEGR